MQTELEKKIFNKSVFFSTSKLLFKVDWFCSEIRFVALNTLDVSSWYNITILYYTCLNAKYGNKLVFRTLGNYMYSCKTFAEIIMIVFRQWIFSYSTSAPFTSLYIRFFVYLHATIWQIIYFNTCKCKSFD